MKMNKKKFRKVGDEITKDQRNGLRRNMIKKRH